MTREEKFIRLLEAYKKDLLSPGEEEELFTLIRLPEYRSLLEKAVEASLHTEELQGPLLSQSEADAMLQTIRSKTFPAPAVVSRRLFPRIWVRYAAAVLLIVGATYYIATREKSPEQPLKEVIVARDLPPGKNGAVLTLADGSSVVLDSIHDGLVASEAGVEVMMEKGQLNYVATGELPDDKMYNTMTTPNGRQFHLRLPDGTGVWLNAASSITYPITFRGPERVVSITGEAYFEVAPRLLMPQSHTSGKTPFIVKINSSSGDPKGQVEVLGTHFNINAYDDEGSEKITLLEGSIKVSGRLEESSRVLSPGQQADLVADPGSPAAIVVTDQADLERAVAWKNGQFYFNGDNIKTIMRQVEKWYDVRVAFESDIDHSFVARISREVNVSSLLRILELTDLVHFEIQDDKIIVKK